MSLTIRCVIAALLLGLATASRESAAPPRDAYGDPLPVGSVARMGTIRFTVPDRVWSVAFSPDGQYLAVGTHGNGDIHLLDARTGLPVRRLLGHKGWGSHVRFLPDGTLLSANRAGAIWLWNIATGQVLRQLDPPPGLIQGLSLSSSGSLLATFGE